MKPYIQDADLTIYVGDALETLRAMPAGSVNCCVTSPPYWGLRDYGTGSWDGGNPDCDHGKSLIPHTLDDPQIRRSTLGGGKKTTMAQAEGSQFRDVCGKCGATRVDRQLGLEPTPDEYVTNMVAVFREVRRVLADDGTLWLNLGDSYASSPPGNKGTPDEAYASSGLAGAKAGSRYMQTLASSVGTKRNTVCAGLKPKDLVGIPWRVAFALQADGWYLRSDIIWAKPNPMPESVTDRPTKAHEYVFLLSKQPRYFFDQEAVRERYLDGPGLTGGAYSPPGQPPHGNARGPDGRRVTAVVGQDGSEQHRNGERWPNPTGRNVRSVWEIATQPYAQAHFATFPEELPRRCILAGCPEWVCTVCGKARERIIERSFFNQNSIATKRQQDGALRKDGDRNLGGRQFNKFKQENPDKFGGWSDCGHSNRYKEDDREGSYVPGTVLDPFLGAGTTALVARKHGRRTIGIELNPEYARLAADRCSQLSLLALAGGEAA